MIVSEVLRFSKFIILWDIGSNNNTLILKGTNNGMEAKKDVLTSSFSNKRFQTIIMVMMLYPITPLPWKISFE